MMLQEPMKEQISQLITEISVGLHEREEIVALSLLAILSGQSVFLYGPPGTAKSLVARRLSLAFKESKYFEYLMNRFSTPEEVFGPVSIKELKEDRYVRKPKGYLPEADIAFLDEIWKSSPAILNTLLTIINERKFRNGDKVVDVPLKGIVAASNEIPPENQGLEALYDRFIMRLVVNPMSDRRNFEALLKDVPTDAVVPVDESLKFDAQKWKNALDSLDKISISEESLNVINAIRVRIDEFNKKRDNKSNIIYISDRRWQKMSRVMKMAAYLCDRDKVMPVDVLVLKNCLWTKEDNKAALAKMVEDSVRDYSLFNFEKFERWTDEYETLKKEIDDTFFFDSDVYEGTEVIHGKKYFKVEIKVPYLKKVIRKDSYGWDREERQVSHRTEEVFMPMDCFKTEKSFFPLNRNHEDFSEYKDPSSGFYYAKTNIQCNFKGTATCTVSYQYKESDYSYGYDKTAEQKIPIKPSYKAGDCKKVAPKVKKMYQENVKDLLDKYDSLEKEVSDFYSNLTQENDTPFVTKKDQAVISTVVDNFRKEMRIGRMNAEQLQVKLNQHIDNK